MKRILLYICMYPIMTLAGHEETFHQEKSFHDPDDIISERDNRNTFREPLQKKESINSQKSTQTPLKEESHDTTKQKTSTMGKRLDFQKFNREDALRKIQRDAEDKQRQEQWKIEDQKEQESRKDQSFFERGFNKMSGVHSTGQEEKEAVRSKNIFETNKARMQQDFEKQSKRFDSFAEVHTDFKSGDGATLLKLGKMDQFITMDKETRTALLEDVSKLVNDDTRLEKFNIQAMQDLVQLTRLSIGKQNLQIDQLDNFNRMVSSEISAENEPAVKTALIKYLKDSINLSLESMKKFNDAIESDSIQDSIKDLASIQRVKNFSNHATMVLGTAGLVVMCIPGVSHIASAIHLTAEKLFIGAKALFLGAHASGGVEGHFQKVLQDKYVDAFQHLLPESTKLLKTEIIKTIEEKGFFKKAKDWFKDKAQKADTALENSKIGDHYKNAKEKINSVTDSISKAARKLFRKIGTDEAQKEIAQEFSLGVKFTPEEKEKLTNDEIAKAEIQSKITSLQNKIEQHKTSKGITNNQPFDIELYKMQDELNSHLRTQEDLLRDINWQKEDAAAKKQRDKQNLSERTLKGASTDAGIDKEKENVRNKEIIDINRKRMQEDFTVKAERFTSFVENNPDFAVKKPWNNLLRLGDMNKFTTMTPEEREALLTSIETSMTDFFNNESETFDNKDTQAAQQLILLTNLYRPTSEKLPETIIQALQSETASANPDEIKQALKAFFNESTKATLATLREFSKNLDVNMDSLDKIRNAKAVSFGSIIIVGIAGAAVMVTGHPLVFHKVKITLEQCALVGKAALLGSHVSSHEEKDIVKEIQNQYTKTFQAILPESTKLIEAINYKNEAKSIGQRLKETTIGGFIHRNIMKPIADFHEKHTKSYTDAAKAKAKDIGHTIAKKAKDFHENTIKPKTDAVKSAVQNTAQKLYEKSGVKSTYENSAVKKYLDNRNTAKKDKLQRQFNLAGTPETTKANQPTTTTQTNQTPVAPAPATA